MSPPFRADPNTKTASANENNRFAIGSSVPKSHISQTARDRHVKLGLPALDPNAGWNEGNGKHAFPLVDAMNDQVGVGAACRSRTDDLLITNQLLYQLS